MARLEGRATVVAVIVHGHADGVREHSPTGIHKPACSTLVDRLGESGAAEDDFHGRPGVVLNGARCETGLDAFENGVAVVEHELQKLALFGRKLATDRPHAGDVARVVMVL